MKAIAISKNPTDQINMDVVVMAMVAAAGPQAPDCHALVSITAPIRPIDDEPDDGAFTVSQRNYELKLIG